MLLFKGERVMKKFFQHFGKIVITDTYPETLKTKKNKDRLASRMNSVVQRNTLLANFSQGKKFFEKWSQEVSNAGKLFFYENYNWQQAAVVAMIL